MMVSRLDEVRLQLYAEADLSLEWIRWCRGTGINFDEATAHAGVVIGCRLVFDDSGFHLDRAGTRSVAIEALGEDAETVIDVVAWPLEEPDRFRRAIGWAAGLGISQVTNPASYFGGRPLLVHRTPLRWLQAGCCGVVVLDRHSAPRWLGEALGRIAGEDVGHGRQLARMLHGSFDRRRIVAPVRRAA
jgi:hypothetical protein